MATPHISAEPGDFAPDVLMPGDPRRAKLIAETFFDDARLVTEVRGILGYTGTYAGRPISVLASGMGMPSVSIYATELARFYGVKRIIRVGTMGALQDHLNLGDVVAASAAHTDSAMTSGWVPTVTMSHSPSFDLLRRAVAFAEDNGRVIHVGPVFTSDSFYSPDPTVVERLIPLGTLAVEMEAAGLYAVGARERIDVLTLGTVSDKPGEEMSAQERENLFRDMVAVALGAFASDAR